MIIPGVLQRHDPAMSLPLIFDSPHSGTTYPADFTFAAPCELVRAAEDTHVEALFEAAPEHGATLLAALFPRSYIDANRHVYDLDPALFEGNWPGPLQPGEKSRLGVGLIRRLAIPGVPMYAHRLSVAEVRARIEKYYLPYHDALAGIVDTLYARFGALWHVNCHSMGARGNEMGPDGNAVRADFVLGDRDGTTCSPVFTDLVAQFLRDRGYRVALNDPYKGAEIVRRYSDPTARRHCLQIEINRGLYMNELNRERSDGFSRVQSDMTALVRFLAGYVRSAIA